MQARSGTWFSICDWRKVQFSSKLLLITFFLNFSLQGSNQVASGGGGKQPKLIKIAALRQADSPEAANLQDVDLLDAFNQTRCGLVEPDSDASAETLPPEASYVLIQMGPSAHEKELDVRVTCGGVLLKPDIVLTTASCVQGPVYTTRIVAGLQLGHESQRSLHLDSYRMRRESSTLQFRWAESVCAHPNYAKTRDGNKNDIALLKLRQPLDFNAHVGPVCIDNSLANFNRTGHVFSISNSIYEVPMVENSDRVKRYQEKAKSRGLRLSGQARSGAFRRKLQKISVKLRCRVGSKILHKTVACLGGRDGNLCESNIGDPVYQTQDHERIRRHYLLAIKSEHGGENICYIDDQKRAFYTDLANSERDLVWLFNQCYGLEKP